MRRDYFNGAPESTVCLRAWWSGARMLQEGFRSRAAYYLSGLVWMVGSATAGPSFTASLDRNVVPAGETVTLSLVFEGVSPPTSPSLPALPNLSLTPGVSQSSEFSF